MTSYTTTRVTQGRASRRHAVGLIVAFALGVGVTHLTTADQVPEPVVRPLATTAETINGSDVHLYNQAAEIEFQRRCQQARP
jgi:hypothetical protein